MTEREFLFEYRFDGETYGLPIVAKDRQDAERKIAAMAYARYKGEVSAKVFLSPRSIWRKLLTLNGG